MRPAVELTVQAADSTRGERQVGSQREAECGNGLADGRRTLGEPEDMAGERLIDTKQREVGLDIDPDDGRVADIVAGPQTDAGTAFDHVGGGHHQVIGDQEPAADRSRLRTPSH